MVCLDSDDSSSGASERRLHRRRIHGCVSNGRGTANIKLGTDGYVIYVVDAIELLAHRNRSFPTRGYILL